MKMNVSVLPKNLFRLTVLGVDTMNNWEFMILKLDLWWRKKWKDYIYV